MVDNQITNKKGKEFKKIETHWGVLKTKKGVQREKTKLRRRWYWFGWCRPKYYRLRDWKAKNWFRGLIREVDKDSCAKESKSALLY